MNKATIESLLARWREIKVFPVILVGLCAVLAVSVSLPDCLALGITLTVVLVCTNGVIALLRRFFRESIHFVVNLFIGAFFVSVVDLLLQAFLPNVSERLGIYVPLLAFNIILLLRAGMKPSTPSPLDAVWDGLSAGLVFTGILVLLGAIRELLGSGTLWNIPVFAPGFQPVLLLRLPWGGLLILGMVAAAIQAVAAWRKGRSET